MTMLSSSILVGREMTGDTFGKMGVQGARWVDRFVFFSGILSSEAENTRWASRMLIEKVCNIVGLSSNDNPARTAGVVLLHLFKLHLVSCVFWRKRVNKPCDQKL